MTARETQVYRDILGFRESLEELEVVFVALFAATRKARGDGVRNADLVDMDHVELAESYAKQLFHHMRRIFKTQ